MGDRDNSLKEQISIEYLSIFTGALVVLIVVVAVIGSFLFSNNGKTYTPSSCYISPQINCLQLAVASNGIQTKAVIIFVNNLGQTVHFSANSFVIYPTLSTSYVGLCYPVNALPGAAVICNATLGGYNPNYGIQLNPKFQITYSECKGNNCAKTFHTFNTVGTGTTSVSAGAGSLYQVRLVTAPYGVNGIITLNGIPYTSNTIVDFFNGATYTIYASPPAGYAFGGWASSSGVFVQSTGPQTATTSATENGIIVASFTAITPTGPAPTVRLNIPNAFDPVGQSDVATATTSNSYDYVAIYCTSSTGSCPSSQLGNQKQSVSVDLGSLLSIGTYNIQACDTLYNACSASVFVQVANAYQLSILGTVTDGSSTSSVTGLIPISPATWEAQGSSYTPSIGGQAGYYYQPIGWSGSCTGSLTNSCPSVNYYTGSSTPSQITMYGNIQEQVGLTGNYLLTIQSTCTAGTCPTATAIPSSVPGAPVPANYYPQGTQITLTVPTSTPGYTFTGWSGTGSGSYTSTSTALSQTFTMPNNPVTETALFTGSGCQLLTLQAYPTVAASPPTASPTSAGGCPINSYPAGTSIALTLGSPNAGYTFGGWNGINTGSYSSTPLYSPSDTAPSLTMPNNPITEQAYYNSNPIYNLNSNSQGQVTGVSISASATLTPPPASYNNYYFCVGGVDEYNAGFSFTPITGAQDEGTGYSTGIGQQTSSSCSESGIAGSSSRAIGIMGITSQYAPVLDAASSVGTSGSPFSMTYTDTRGTSGSWILVLLTAVGDKTIATPTITGGTCLQYILKSASGTAGNGDTSYAYAYAWLCNGATGTVSISTSGVTGTYSAAAYSFD